jgi:RimJ/RimL family protein N-acetyltransferase
MKQEHKLILITERLVLRQFTTSDTTFVVELLNSPGWLEFIGDRHVKTDDDAVNYLENGPIKSYALNGYGLFLVELKNTGEPIGMCGIINRDYLEHPDIGFAFLPGYMGKGYAFEIASATMSYATNTLALPKIFAITLPGNKLSIKLLTKLRMRCISQFWLPDNSEQLLLFSN